LREVDHVQLLLLLDEVDVVSDELHHPVVLLLDTLDLLDYLVKVEVLLQLLRAHLVDASAHLEVTVLKAAADGAEPGFSGHVEHDPLAEGELELLNGSCLTFLLVEELSVLALDPVHGGDGGEGGVECGVATQDPAENLHQNSLNTSQSSNEVHEAEDDTSVNHLVRVEAEVERGDGLFLLSSVEAVRIVEHVVVEGVNVRASKDPLVSSEEVVSSHPVARVAEVEGGESDLWCVDFVLSSRHLLKGVKIDFCVYNSEEQRLFSKECVNLGWSGTLRVTFFPDCV